MQKEFIKPQTAPHQNITYFCVIKIDNIHLP